MTFFLSALADILCNRCKTRASLPLDAIRRPRDTPIWKLEAALKCRSCRKGRYAPPLHMDQADRNARDHPLPLGASTRGTVSLLGLLRLSLRPRRFLLAHLVIVVRPGLFPPPLVPKKAVRRASVLQAIAALSPFAQMRDWSQERLHRLRIPARHDAAPACRGLFDGTVPATSSPMRSWSKATRRPISTS